MRLVCLTIATVLRKIVGIRDAEAALRTALVVANLCPAEVRRVYLSDGQVPRGEDRDDESGEGRCALHTVQFLVFLVEAQVAMC